MATVELLVFQIQVMNSGGTLETVTKPEDIEYPQSYYWPLEPYRDVTHRIKARITGLSQANCDRATMIGVVLKKG